MLPPVSVISAAIPPRCAAKLAPRPAMPAGPNLMHRIALALAALLVASAPAAAEGPVGCRDFRTNWTSALGKLGLASAAPSFGTPDKDDIQAVQGIVGIEARFACREDIVGQLGLRAVGEAAGLERAAASVLMGLDAGMSQTDALAMATALKTESQSSKKEATSAWGPYELSWNQGVGGGQFTLNLPEN